MVVGLAVLAAMLTALPAVADRDRALELAGQARALIDKAQYDQARPLLEQAQKADPTAPEVYLLLGYFEELQGKVDPAVAAYVQALTLSPATQYAQDRLRGLFYGKRFPWRLPLSGLALVPVEMLVDKAQAPPLPGATAAWSEPLAYTTGLLYPESMHGGGGVLERPLPIAGAAAGEKCRFNRVCYGFTAAPASPELLLRVAVYYPSTSLSRDAHDYAATAVLLTHWLTRLFAYHELRLGAALPEEPTAVYLCEGGPTGAETYAGGLYFYNLGGERAPLEWMREAAHETGHLLLPKVGRFTEPEPWGSGHLGERLALQWLAEEAGLVAGAPWPAPAAQERLRGLWGGQPIGLAEYLAQSCRPLLDSWTQLGPDSPLLTQGNTAGLSYFLGFMLWAQAAYGDEILAATLRESPGTNPTDYVRSCQEVVGERLAARDGVLTLRAEGLNLAASHLAQKPQEGAVGREGIALAAGDSAIWPLYLPAGAWEITILTAAGPLPAGIAAEFDGRAATLQGDKNAVLTVRTAAPGWHRLTLRAGEGAAATVGRFLVTQGAEA